MDWLYSKLSIGTTECTMYEKIVLVDFVHDMSKIYTEIWVPGRNVIIRQISDTKYYIFPATKPEITDKVEKIRKVQVSNAFIRTAIVVYNAEQRLNTIESPFSKGQC